MVAVGELIIGTGLNAVAESQATFVKKHCWVGGHTRLSQALIQASSKLDCASAAKLLYYD